MFSVIFVCAQECLHPMMYWNRQEGDLFSFQLEGSVGKEGLPARKDQKAETGQEGEPTPN